MLWGFWRFWLTQHKSLSPWNRAIDPDRRCFRLIQDLHSAVLKTRFYIMFRRLPSQKRFVVRPKVRSSVADFRAHYEP